jgi:tRNA(Ile2) C34 agmatinyltransferase TiaS
MRVICPTCSVRMMHLGYFRWLCHACGARRPGDLPERESTWQTGPGRCGEGK